MSTFRAATVAGRCVTTRLALPTRGTSSGRTSASTSVVRIDVHDSPQWRATVVTRIDAPTRDIARFTRMGIPTRGLGVVKTLTGASLAMLIRLNGGLGLTGGHSTCVEDGRRPSQRSHQTRRQNYLCGHYHRRCGSRHDAYCSVVNILAHPNGSLKLTGGCLISAGNALDDLCDVPWRGRYDVLWSDHLRRTSALEFQSRPAPRSASCCNRKQSQPKICEVKYERTQSCIRQW